MKFSLDCKIEVGETTMSPAGLRGALDEHLEAVKEISTLEGELVLLIDGKPKVGAQYSDPILRLTAGWLRKVPWVIAGDTETVALRNSEHVFAFVPAGNAVEISFFEGDEAEIEEYLVDPTNVLLSDFAEASIAFGRLMLELVEAIDPEQLDANEDCKDLVASLDEASKAWHEYQVHQRR
jgi:hypothetical protein